MFICGVCCEEILLGNDFYEKLCLVEVEFGYVRGVGGEEAGDLAVVNSVAEGLELFVYGLDFMWSLFLLLSL